MKKSIIVILDGFGAGEAPDASEYGDIVLDCFGGSGSTLMAAQECGRSARVIEISPEYCDVIIHRWEELTGEKHEIISREGI